MLNFSFHYSDRDYIPESAICGVKFFSNFTFNREEDSSSDFGTNLGSVSDFGTSSVFGSTFGCVYGSEVGDGIGSCLEIRSCSKLGFGSVCNGSDSSSVLVLGSDFDCRLWIL